MTSVAEDIEVKSPFPLDQIPRLAFWFEEFRHRVADDFGPRTQEAMLEQTEQQIAAGMQTWAVTRYGEMGGYISATRQTPILADVHCIFKPSFFGRAITDRSIKTVYEQLFHDGIEKITSSVFADNKGIRALAKRIGMREEGRLVAHTRRDGKPVDVIVLGITKQEFVPWQDF